VPSTRLVTIHRQAAASRIVTLAHEVNAGTAERVRGREGDVFAVPEHPLRVADRVAEIVAVRAPEFFALPPSEVQVLAPMYRGPCGVDRLNERIKERLNPAAGRPAVGGFHEGDRVVQTRNDPDLDVANGDIGEVVAADRTARTLQVAYAYGMVTYDLDHAADLAPAWCLTVHKSQGGEWPVVVLVLDPSHRAMLWRELVYTAITRAAHGLLLVGDPGLVVEASRRTGSGLRDRRTLLTERLTEALRRDTQGEGIAAAEVSA
jgi:exodeoxyribonuclease V alpha subunit